MAVPPCVRVTSVALALKSNFVNLAIGVAVLVRTHVLDPAHPLDQPSNTESAFGIAVSVTLPWYGFVQSDPQSIPAGLLVTFPDPVPIFDTLTSKEGATIVMPTFPLCAVVPLLVVVQSYCPPLNAALGLAVYVIAIVQLVPLGVQFFGASDVTPCGKAIGPCAYITSCAIPLDFVMIIC